MLRVPPFRSLLAVTLPCLALGACGEDAKEPARSGFGQAGSNAAGGSAGTASTAGGNGGGAEPVVRGGTGGGGGGIVLGGSGTGGGPAFAECAKESAKADLRPLDLYIVLDRSGSMVGVRWPAVSKALSSFVKDPGATGVAAGIQFFPLSDEAKVCKYEAYAVPAVSIAALPGNAVAIDAALVVAEPPKAVGQPNLPTSNTPTLPALQGAYDFARSWATAHPDRTVVVLLATDGEPNACGSTVENSTQVAKNALAAVPSIPTFVVGVGKELVSLDLVAAAGGSQKAILVDAEAADTQAQFVAALEKVRGTALPCSVAIPKVTGALDANLVNVKSTTAAGQETFLGRVASAAACGADGVGWYYDDPAAPKEVSLCASSCLSIRKAAGSLDIVFGCVSVLK